MIRHITDIPPIVSRQRRIQQEDNHKESHEYHYDSHKLKSPYFAIIPLGFAAPYSLHVIGKNYYRYGKHEVIADISIILQKVPTELISAVDAYIKDASESRTENITTRKISYVDKFLFI